MYSSPHTTGVNSLDATPLPHPNVVISAQAPSSPGPSHPLQLLSDLRNNHTPLFLFTICQRQREEVERAQEVEGGKGSIDRLPRVLKPDIDFLSFFSKWEKVHCPTESTFLWGFGGKGGRGWGGGRGGTGRPNEHPVHRCLGRIVYRPLVIELSEPRLPLLRLALGF